MTDILDTIIAAKRQEIASLRAIVDIDMLIENSSTPRPFRSMRKALDESSHGIIAEFKRKSPSKGWIKPEGDSRSLPADYEHNGAAALSILTDTPFFGGSLRDIAMARPHTSRPILRKDFIIDEYSSTRHASSVPMPCCSSLPLSTREIAGNWRPKPTNSGWKRCSKFTTKRNSTTCVKKSTW